MSKLRVNAFTVSADGFGAGPDQGRDQPLGRGGEQLHQWFLPMGDKPGTPPLVPTSNGLLLTLSTPLHPVIVFNGPAELYCRDALMSPIEIAYDVPAGATPDANLPFPVSQRVYESDGSFTDRPGGSVTYHAVHGHYHYSSFANALLWRSDRRGAKLGNTPVAASHKVSFCMADIRIDAWGDKGDGPRKYYAPDCLFPSASDGVTDQYRQGVNNGWSDVYDWYIPDQYVEVTGVPSGFYRLEFCADPFNEIEEEREDNNCVVNHIRLSGMEGPNKRVQVLGILKK